MADLIDRQAAMDILHECGGDEMYPPNMIKMRGKMYELPAVDAVEVVYCDKCIYSNSCKIETMLLDDGIENPYCAGGEWR